MKKITLFICLIVFTTTSFAQRGDISNPSLNRGELRNNKSEIASPKNSLPLNLNSLFYEDFEVWPPVNWTINNGIQSEGDEQWHQELTGYDQISEYDFGNSAVINKVEATANPQDEWLITPKISLPSNNKLVLSFAFRSSFGYLVAPNDFADLFVKISSDDGSTWQTIWEEGDSVTVVNSGVDYPWNSITFYNAVIDLSAYTNQVVQIAFQYIGQDADFFILDDIEIAERTVFSNNLLFEEFEIWPPANWTIINGTQSAGDEQWHQGPYLGVFMGKGAAVDYVEANVNPQDEWLITPEITIPATGNFYLYFEFIAGYPYFVDPNNNADLMVKISTDGGTTWDSPIWQEDNSTLVVASGVPFPWETYKIHFPNIGINSYKSKAINIAFHYNGQNADLFLIDNVIVYNADSTDTTAINENTFEKNINIFPNPTNDYIHIKGANGTQISIYNILGEKVKEISNTSATMNISMADLSKGTYVIRITDGEKSLTRKISKL